MLAVVGQAPPFFLQEALNGGWGWVGATAALPKEVKDVANGTRRPGRIWREGQREAGRRRRNNAPSPHVPGEASLMGRELCLGKAHSGSEELCSGTPPRSPSGGGP